MENKDNLMQNRLYHINDVATPGEQATKTVFYSTDSTSGSVWLVKPGQVVAPHQHTTSDDLWICVQGKGVFYPEPGIETAISKGDIVLSGKGNCLYCISAPWARSSFNRVLPLKRRRDNDSNKV